jgi:hypothetical protein
MIFQIGSRSSSGRHAANVYAAQSRRPQLPTSSSHTSATDRGCDDRVTFNSDGDVAAADQKSFDGAPDPLLAPDADQVHSDFALQR